LLTNRPPRPRAPSGKPVVLPLAPVDTPPAPKRMSPFAEHMGFDVTERTDGGSVVECTVAPEHANTRGVAHGGIMSALVDMACGVAVAYQPAVGGKPAVTVALTVNYLHPAQIGDRLRAAGKRCGTGRRTFVAQAEITNQDGVVVAVGVATMRVVG
jgi:uncharacterized protein (TIGR00369 family)